MAISFSITLVIIIITCLVSIVSFSNERLFNDLIFYPPAVSEHGQYYRFFSCGLIHANYLHLGFNMYSLWMFGTYVEREFTWTFGNNGRWLYLVMYITSLYVCLLPTYFRNRHNTGYRSLGASGAVSAVIFAFIFLNPMQELGIVLIPFYVPGFVFGILYLVISSVLDKRQAGNINHSAHIWGALYGISFLIAMGPIFSDHRLLSEFIFKVKEYFVR